MDIADLSCMQDACHMNFVIDLAHLSVSAAPEVLGWIPHGDSELFFCPTLVTRRKTSFSRCNLFVI